MHRKPTPQLAIAVLAALLPAAAAWAADSANDLAALKSMSLEDLGEIRVNTVVGASKYEQKTTEAPSSVSIITQEEIKLYGWRNLAQILGSLQGFNVSYDRNNYYLGVRGLSLGDFNSRVLLLIDGHRMNNNLTDSAGIGNEFLLDASLIDRVEVIRGPGSVLYGNNAFFAVVNVITRKAAQVNGVEVGSEYGDNSAGKFAVSTAKEFTNGISVLFSGSYAHSDGEKHLEYTPPPASGTPGWVSTGLDSENYGSVFSTLKYQDLTLQGGLNRREKTDPTAFNFTALNDPRAKSVSERSYVDLSLNHEFTDIANLVARLYYDRYNLQSGFPYPNPTPPNFYQDNQAGEWWGAEVQVNKKIWDQHMVSLGAEFRDDFRQHSDVVDNLGNHFTKDASRVSHGVFAEGDFVLRDDLHFNGGVRYDQYGNFDPSFSPRLGLIYHPLEKSTFKALYGTAFRAPNFQEISDSSGQLKTPETIDSYELVYEQGIGEHLRSSLSGFYNQMNGLIVFQNGTYNNVNADTRGMEVALDGLWPKGLRSRVSYTWQQTQNLSGGSAFPDSPEHMAKLNLSVPVYQQKVFASLEFQYFSRRHTYFTDPNTASTLPGMDVLGYPTFNLTIFSRDIVKNLELSASLYNVLDEHYADPATRFHVQDQVPQDGRSFRLKLAYRF
jgi:iron complex outermembrane receptor protein